VYKQKQKELTRQKQENKEFFANCMTLENDLALKNCLRSQKLAVENAFHSSSTTAPKNSLDDTKQYATLLRLQGQSVVARVNFSHKETRGLYQTLMEQSKKLSSFSSGNLQNKLLVLRP
jgi:hypothetical protein